MAISALEAKAHELLGQLEPKKLAAVVQLLEVIVTDSSEPVSPENQRRFVDGKKWLAEHGGNGIPRRKFSQSSA